MQRRQVSRIATWVVCTVAIAIAGCAGEQPREERLPTSVADDFEEKRSGAVEATEVPERIDELGTIYFDFDRYAIREDARPILKANAKSIAASRAWKKITLEGHCDERGSEEYNLALGERRASAAKRYLVSLGVPDSRLTTVSFGESTPAVQGHDESAWRWNRRVEFRVSR
jgi:peptidoglycan-associated lipoprotein